MIDRDILKDVFYLEVPIKTKASNAPRERFVTKSKTLDKLVKDDPRIESWTHEGFDGYWVYLVAGYNWYGCSTLHENTVKDILDALSDIEKGNVE